MSDLVAFSKTTRAICILCLCSFGPPVWPAPRPPQEYLHRTWTRESGLPDNQIRAIQQSRDGYLWIGTRRGLARFDGLRFTVFDRLNTPEMKSEDCMRLAEDTDGNLWIGTADGLLRRSEEGFARFTPEEGLFDPAVTALFASQRGGVWVATRGGVTHIESARIVRYPEADNSSYLGALYEDDHGVLWIGGEGLKRLATEGGPSEIIPPPPAHPFGVAAIHPRTGGGLWVLLQYWREGCVLYSYHDGKWQQVLPLDRRWTTDPDPLKLFLLVDRWGSLWLPSGGRGLISLQESSQRVWSVTCGSASDTNQLPCATVDREGNLWIGTERSGVQSWQPKRVQTLSAREGLVHDNTWALCEDRDGGIWIGTDGGLSHWKEGRVMNYTVQHGLSRNAIRALAVDDRGALWVGTGSGLNVIRSTNIQVHAFPGEWPENKIRVVFTGGDGRVWVGTALGLHLLADGQQTKYTTAEGLPANDVRALLEDKQGNLWVGTHGGGLCTLRTGSRPSDFAVESATPAVSGQHTLQPLQRLTTTNGLSSNFVWALYQDAEGVLWIGTERGLNRWKDGRVFVFTRNRGLPDDLVNQILEDDLGTLWISHDHGIYRVAKQSLNDLAAGRNVPLDYVSYDEHDGLLSIEANGQKSQPAGLKTRDGRLWFATTRGVVIFDPRQLPDITTPPRVHIEQIRANGRVLFDTSPRDEPRAYGSSRHRTPTTFSQTQIKKSDSRVHLRPGSARFLEIQYTACTFVAPEKTRFKYRLEGLDTDWVDAGPIRKAYYANLAPGNYRFQVIAGNKHGEWDQSGALFSFHLAPFFYQTASFYTGAGLTLAGLAYLAYRWRLARLGRIQLLQRQMALLHERVRIAKDLHDGLGGNLTQLALLADLADGSAPDPKAIAERFQKLSRSTREALHAVRDIIWSTQPAHDTLESLVLRICEHAENLLAPAGTRCRFDLPAPLPAVPLPSAQRQQILYAAQEALNNVVKHARASELRIVLEIEPLAFTLTFIDNGRGFDPSGQRPGIGDGPFRSPGHGVRNMWERIESIGGRFTLDSQPGRGTIIQMHVVFS